MDSRRALPSTQVKRTLNTGVWLGSLGMSGPAAERAMSELSGRRKPRSGRPLPPGHPKRLQAPDLSSVRILSERNESDESAVALTVEDEDGNCYLVIRVVRREADGWRRTGGSEGLVRSITGVHDPYLPLYAYANGRFFGGGSLHTTLPDVAHVRLVWEDGQQIDAEVENGIVLFFGTRDSLEPATLEFLDSSGSVVGQRLVFVDER
jgi:hypothetical protein